MNQNQKNMVKLVGVVIVLAVVTVVAHFVFFHSKPAARRPTQVKSRPAAGRLTQVKPMPGIKLPTQQSAQSDEEQFQASMKRREKRAEEWNSLPFDSLSDNAKIKTIAEHLKLNLYTAMDERQEKALRETIAEFMRIQAQWDIDGYVRFSQSRDMIASKERFEAIRSGYDFTRKAYAERNFKMSTVLSAGAAGLPDDPILLFKHVFRLDNTDFDSDGHSDRDEKVGGVPSACATSASYITVSDKLWHLPFYNPALYDYFMSSPPLGIDTPYFTPRISPMEPANQGKKFIWAQLSVIFQPRKGKACPDLIIFFWNPDVSNWAIYECYSLCSDCYQVHLLI